MPKHRRFLVATSAALVAAFIGVVFPVAALAKTCMQDDLGDIFAAEVVAVVGTYVLVIGEVVGGAGDQGIIGAGSRFAFSGSARIQGDGTAQFGITIPADDENNVPVWVQGTLNPPAFTSGSGFFDDLFGGFEALTFTPAACP